MTQFCARTFERRNIREGDDHTVDPTGPIHVRRALVIVGRAGPVREYAEEISRTIGISDLLFEVDTVVQAAEDIVQQVRALQSVSEMPDAAANVLRLDVENTRDTRGVFP